MTRKLKIFPITDLSVGKKGEMIQRVGQDTRFYSMDDENGLRVTEEWNTGMSGGYPYMTVRRKEPPTRKDLEDLLEHKRLNPFRGTNKEI